jgi:hypothetical protein
MSLCLATNTLLGVISTALVGTVTPDEIKSYVSINHDPWDNNEQIDFHEPMGSFGIEYDVHSNIRLFAEHLSSPMQCDDHPGINHVGVKFLMPINDVTAYSGISINHSEFDSNDNFDGPLVSLGAEYGESIKLYIEHLTTIKHLEDGRTSLGFKVFFK